MHELLCVLLYLVLIFTDPGEYYESEIYAIESANQSAVDDVENDPVRFSQVVNDYSDQANLIVLLNPHED